LAFDHDRVGRIVFLEMDHPGRLVSIFAILVIDFVTALFNLGVKKTAWWMIKYPRIKKNAQQFLHPVLPILGSQKLPHRGVPHF
jgi:hypothetical protein